MANLQVAGNIYFGIALCMGILLAWYKLPNVKFIKVWKYKKRQAKDSAYLTKEKVRLSKVFNNLYTYRNKTIINETEGNYWMCRECNSIHLSNGYSAIDGLHYPKCCSTDAGHRLDENIQIPSIDLEYEVWKLTHKL